LVALIVLPGTALLLGAQLVPWSSAPLGPGGRGEREQSGGDDPLHPSDGCSSPLGVSSSSVVVLIASKCSSFSMFRRIGRSMNRSGAAASAGGGSGGGGALSGASARSGAFGAAGGVARATFCAGPETDRAPGVSPVRRTIPTA